MNVTNFNTTFEFVMMPGTNPFGNGLAFVVEGVQQMKVAPDYGDSMLKIAPTPGQMTVLDFFTPSDQKHLAIKDLDLGTSGTILVPSQNGSNTPAAAIVLAKNGELFVTNPNNLGQLNAPVQTFFVNSPPNSRTIGAGQWGSPLYYNGHVYIHAEDDVLKSYQVITDPATGATMLNPTPTTAPGPVVTYPGTNPSISANGNQNGIVWDLDISNFSSGGPAILRAYDASTLQLLYDSSQDPTSQAGAAVKFTTPMVVDGHVFVPTAHELDVFGLRSSMLPRTGPGGPLATFQRRRG